MTFLRGKTEPQLKSTQTILYWGLGGGGFGGDEISGYYGGETDAKSRHTRSN